MHPLDPGYEKAAARRDRLRRARRHGGTALFVAALALGALMLLPPLFGYERYVITGGSMTGTIERGAIVYAKPVPVDELAVGDVITYTPPRGAGPGGKVTHRIVWAGFGESGARAFRTKGDANQTADPWKFELRRPTQARVVAHVPYVGYPLAVLGSRRVRVLVIGLPAALVAIAVVAGAWRQAGVDVEAARSDLPADGMAA
jgi:signal peptidase